MYLYESAEIPLSDVCEQFGLQLDQAKRKAASHELPVAFYKKATKGGYYCSIIDWANHINSIADASRAEWMKMNNHTQGMRG
jgi:hypothetical protein